MYIEPPVATFSCVRQLLGINVLTEHLLVLDLLRYGLLTNMMRQSLRYHQQRANVYS